MGDKLHVDEITARLMLDAGVAPEEVARRSKQQLHTISKPIHETIAYMFARGMNQTEVAEALGMDTTHINLLANSDRMKFEVKTLTYKLFGKDIQKQFKEILPEAVEVAAEVMRDPKAKPAIRLNAATNFMDRALGRPKQSVEVEGSLIRELFDKLDGKKKAPTIEVENIPDAVVVSKASPMPTGNPNELIPKDKTHNPNLNPDFDKLDSWVDKNL